MEPNYIFWVALVAFALHTLEEHAYDWESWAQKVLKLVVDWSHFYVARVVMLFIGLACAWVGWTHATFGLIFPALLLVDALAFHIVPYVRSNRKFSPGMLTAIFLFLPIGIKSFTMAIDLKVYNQALLIAGGAGILLAVFPLFLLKTKNLDFFKQ